MKTSILMACTAAVLAGIGCGGGAAQTAEPKLSSAGPESERVVGWPALGRGEARFIRIDLGPDSFAECQKISPKFPFDSSTALAQDEQQVVALASCLNAPGMRERTILLVGRADPQGTDVYNDKLGTRRANAIKKILVDHGIADSRITIRSEGEKGAVGDQPEYARGYDRRVDVIVSGGTHAP